MQIIPSYEDVFIAVPGLLVGLAIGYIIAGQEDLNAKYRIGLGVITSLFGGFITGLLLYNYLDNTTFEVLLIILSYFGGYALGAIANWAPLPEKPPKRRIIFEPDDDDDFDREIEEAMGGDFKANNS
ncbi:MAG: hypothetical protein ACFFBL_09880 [Promethearchaeota archaeon]